MSKLLVAALLCAGGLAPAVAAADPVCRGVEIRFAPGAPALQIAVWIEDGSGNYVDTAYVTRSTGQFGLGNRPGVPLLKTDFRWPYGRREMVLPIWAHRRNHHYPKVVMGGACGNAPGKPCPDGTKCTGGPGCGAQVSCDCDDTTIAYHSKVSSYEPFYCSPTGASKIDAMSCASKGTFSKGAYADPPAFSLYPPRADLMAYSAGYDAPEVDPNNPNSFTHNDDLVAISQATPLDGKPLDPPVTWLPANLPDGDYVAWIELSQESDWNAANPQNNQRNVADTVQQWDYEGHAFLGQPSVVYRVPFHLGPSGWSAIATDFAGYSTWDGSDGVLHPDDGSITKGQNGTGAGRLLSVNDGVDQYRVKVVVGACAPVGDGGVGDGGNVSPCAAMAPPDPPANLVLAPAATSIGVTFAPPSSGVQANRFSVRYREGAAPITDETFDTAVAWGEQPLPAKPGDPVATTITGLLASTTYSVAVRGVSPCMKPSHVVSATVTTPAQKFVTLNGCFVATAAYGTPMAGAVDDLRKFRDERLLASAAGRLLVASYYAFSPPLANAIAADRRLRAAARAVIAPLAALAAR